MQQIQVYFEPAILKHEDFLTKYEPKVFSVLGRDNDSNTKEIALRGVATMKEELNKLIEERKIKTNIFNVIVKQFTERERKAQDLIDRLQNKANVCLQEERKSVEQANKIITEKREEAVKEIESSEQISDTAKAIAKAELEAAAQVELLDAGKARVKLGARVVNKLAVPALLLWYITTEDYEAIDIDKIDKLSIGNMLVAAKRENAKSGLQIQGIEFTKVEIAK